MKKLFATSIVILLVAWVAVGCTPSTPDVSAQKAVEIARQRAAADNQKALPTDAKLDLGQASAKEGDAGAVWYVSFPYHGGGGGTTYLVDRRTGNIDKPPIAWDPPPNR